MKRNKAFKVLLIAPATKFDGPSRLKFKPWREALNREVKILDLEADQLVDLLQARTSGQAHTALQPSLIIQLESTAEDALGNALSILEERYKTPQRPSQKIIHDILNCPRVNVNDPDLLFTDASNCEAAVFLKVRGRRTFASLDGYTTLQYLLDRLPTASMTNCTNTNGPTYRRIQRRLRSSPSG